MLNSRKGKGSNEFELETFTTGPTAAKVKTTQANVELEEAAKNKAQAIKIEAEAEADAIRSKAEAEADAIKIKAKADAEVSDINLKIENMKIEAELERQKRLNELKLDFLTKLSQLIKENPALLQIVLNDNSMKSINKILSSETFANLYGSPGSSTFFQRPTSSAKGKELEAAISGVKVDSDPEQTLSYNSFRKT